MTDLPWRAAAAAIIAIFFSAAAGVAISVIATGWPLYAEQMLGVAMFVGVPFAAFHALLVGAPLYAIARRRWPLTWRNAALGGFVTALFPITTLALIQTLLALLSGWTPITAAWLIGMFWFGVSGAAGGLAFRAVRGADARREAKA